MSTASAQVKRDLSVASTRRGDRRSAVRLLVVDGDPWVRSKITAEFVGQRGIELVGAIDETVGLSTLVRQTSLDVLLLSAASIDLDLLLLVGQLTAGPGAVRVALFTDSTDHGTVLAARGYGATCYLVRADEFDLPTAVRATAAGAVLMSPTAARAADAMVAQVVARHALVADAALTDLSVQQRKVLGLLAQGKTNAAIALELQVTAATVKWHVAKLLERLHQRDRAQLTAYAHAHGIFAPPPRLD